MLFAELLILMQILIELLCNQFLGKVNFELYWYDHSLLLCIWGLFFIAFVIWHLLLALSLDSLQMVLLDPCKFIYEFNPVADMCLILKSRSYLVRLSSEGRLYIYSMYLLQHKLFQHSLKFWYRIISMVYYSDSWTVLKTPLHS